MARPIVIAHHLIWTLYGWWLPNDPRGSCSRIIRSEILKPLGELHYGRKKIQPASTDIREFYDQASPRLKHPLLDLSAGAIEAAAAGFSDAVREIGYTCYACAILFDHVHLIIRKHKHSAEHMIENLQNYSRLRLSREGFRTNDHPTWCHGGWKIFLDHPDEVWRTIRYVEENPLPYRMPRQLWDFVTPYDGWPLHEGHCVNSPYVKLLKAAGRYPRDRGARR
jgi:REP element-mobilizing transposase RayT